MYNISFQVVEILYSFMRSSLCVTLLDHFFKRKYISWRQPFFNMIIVIPPTLLSYLNSYEVAYSNAMILFSVVYLAIVTGKVVWESNFYSRFIIISLCTIASIFIELLVIFATSYLKKNFSFGNIIFTVGSYKRMLYLIIIVLIWIATYHLARHFMPKSCDIIQRYKLLMFGIVLIGLLSTVFFQRVYLVIITQELVVLWGSFLIWIVLSMAVFGFYLKYRRTQERTLLIEVKNRMLEENYHNVSTLNEQNSSIYHDFHNHLLIIHRLLRDEQYKEAQNYILTIIEPIELIENKVDCGNEILNMVINYKIYSAAGHKIKVECDIDQVGELNIEGNDMCSIFSNLFDNAIEACLKLSEGDRWIELSIKKKNELFVLYMKNSIGDIPKVVNGQLQTSKINKAMHGLGVKSIISSVNKYHGYFDYKYSKSVFVACITMNC